MLRIRQALSTLPTRPVLVVAPLIIVLVLAFYYRDRHAKCTEIRLFRTKLVQALGAEPPGASVRLADFTDFAWDRVRIVTGFVPRDRDGGCPLDWNWAGGERAALIEAGALTALIFAHGEAVTAYRELDGERVAIEGVATLLTPSTAVFALARDAGRVTLTYAGP